MGWGGDDDILCTCTHVQSARNGLLRYILYTCPNLQCNPCSKCYGVDCFGTYFTHLSKPVMQPVFKVLRSGLLRYILYTCPNLQCNPCSKCYGVDCFGTYFTHVQTCNVSRVQSATEWTASVHTLHMSKPVM